MPKFNAPCCVDAYVEYVVEVDADNAEKTAHFANHDFPDRDGQEVPDA